MPPNCAHIHSGIYKERKFGNYRPAAGFARIGRSISCIAMHSSGQVSTPQSWFYKLTMLIHVYVKSKSLRACIRPYTTVITMKLFSFRLLPPHVLRPQPWECHSISSTTAGGRWSRAAVPTGLPSQQYNSTQVCIQPMPLLSGGHGCV